jgi:ubiquinone/menaquinone biosynthesis C-methylase UbiE
MIYNMDELASDIQKNYYAKTADGYDSQHLSHGDEHYLALNYLDGLVKFNDIKTLLDIGAGTGRVALFLKKRNPALKIISIEPVKELRDIGYAKGLEQSELLDGDVYSLPFQNSSFDLVCAFGVFHHLENPLAALGEMQRVSRSSIFISDSNNFGQGSSLSRSIKQTLNSFKLWNLAVLVKTKGKKYSISAGDGLAYSFSLFSLIKSLKTNYSLYFLSTVPSKRNLYKSASHVAVFAQKLN